ncbi:MAG TPA: carbohydrate binding domain-containing protein [bacterium]|nr:carbohydrate binding domain-containing protein [bacterium]HPN43012.1 carbohydrate binding domain-containing protein [bacterium]
MKKRLLQLLFVTVLVSLAFIPVKQTRAAITVNLTNPASGTSFQVGSDITFTANVELTEGSFRDCRLFYNNRSMGKANGSLPTYSFTWENVKSGNYYVFARVRDTDGNQVDSDSILIHVGNISHGDVIMNGDFDYSLAPWVLSNYEGATSTGYVYSDMYFEDTNYVYIDVTNGSTADWHIQLQHLVPLVPDHTYELWFYTDAEEKKTISLTYQMNHDPYTVYFSEQVEIDGAAEFGPYTFVNTFDDPTNLFKFNIGGNNIDCFFDRVRIIDRTMTSVTSRDLSSHNGQISHYELLRNYPNPFNLCTNIQYRLSKPAGMMINIYNVNGQLIRNLINQHVAAGLFTAQWDGLDNNGLVMPSGVYIFSMEIPADKVQLTHKALLLK